MHAKVSPHSRQTIYRPDIDGLRAVAILSVVLFHAFPTVLPGGFVGVDVFFVISGYLITQIVVNALRARKFSFAEFYARRARRILPALLVTSLAVLVAGYFFLLPQEYDRLARSFLASLFFSGNIFFYLTSGYFSDRAIDTPLLHYWSLGVEEQFYLIFPTFVLVVNKWAPRLLVPLLFATTVVSFTAAEIMLRHNPSAAFYLLPFRSGELSIGALLAVGPFRTRSQIVAFVGAAMIAASFFLLRSDARFPGLHALPICLGTAAIIWSGPDTIASRILSRDPLVMIGKWSYSLYLLHWPLHVFAERLFPFANPSIRGCSTLAIAIALSGISYFLIERPARTVRLLAKPSAALGTAAVACLIFSLAAGDIISRRGVTSRSNALVDEYSRFLSIRSDEQFDTGGCFRNNDQDFLAIDWSRCLPQGAGKNVVMWGDSSMAQFSRELRQRLTEAGYHVGQLTASGCPPLVNFDVPSRPQCRDFNSTVSAHIITAKPDLVILGAAWPSNPEPYHHLEETLAALTSAGVPVLLIGVGPLYRAPVPTLLAQRASSGDWGTLSGPDTLNPTFVSLLNDRLVAIAAKYPKVRVIRLFDIICPDHQSCPMVVNGTPMHFDDWHTTEAGARFFVDRIWKAADFR
jgi:peptidoglycan/LPS O-acetylase OafA/YrhL